MIILIEIETRKASLVDTDNVNNIVYNPSVFAMMEFDTETEMLAYIAEHKLEIQNETI